MTVISKCPVPELHLIQGFVNQVFWKGLVPMVGREKALIWPLKLKVVTKNYQGELFEGNACRKLLKNPDILFDSNICPDIFSITLLVSVLKSFNKVVNDCFTSYEISSETRKDITNLRKDIQG